MRELLTYLAREIRAMHGLYDRVTADLTTEQANHVPGGGHQSLAFCLWHYVRTEDNAIQFRLQDRPTVWMADGWAEKFGLDAKSQGTGFTDDEARTFRLGDVAAFRRYMADVFRLTEEYTAQLDEPQLERKVLVKPLGELSVLQIVSGLCLTHGYRHLGEIEFAKGLVAPKGGATI